jgi:hypothetical protein
VEQRNAPAVRLYQTLGYRTVWTDASATTLVPAIMDEEGRSGGGMAQVPTTLVCMRKSLKRGGGIFGRFFQVS